MQKSLNRESFERKLTEVFDLLELGNAKEAMRKVRSHLDKGEKKMHPIERLSYKTVEMYVLEKSNRRQEAVTQAEEIVKEIIAGNINDQPLLEMLDQTLQEMGCYSILMNLREQMVAKNPSDQGLITKLF